MGCRLGRCWGARERGAGGAVTILDDVFGVGREDTSKNRLLARCWGDEPGDLQIPL